MKVLIIVLVVVVVLVLLGLAMAARIVKQYERGVLFRFGRVQGPRNPGFRLIIPFIDVLPYNQAKSHRPWWCWPQASTTRLRRRSLRFPPASWHRKAHDQAGNDPQVGRGPVSA